LGKIQSHCNIVVIQTFTQQTIDRAKDACLFPKAAHFMTPRLVQPHSEQQSCHPILATEAGLLFPSTIMVAQNTRNSWSELLTSCRVPHDACEYTDDRTDASVTRTSTFAQNYPEFLCHGDFVSLRGNAESTMDIVMRPLLARVRSLRAFIAASLRKMLGMEAHDGDFASQRVCPSCGLITPRYETCCLECGKALKPA
jgi:hypothetical protein